MRCHYATKNFSNVALLNVFHFGAGQIGVEPITCGFGDRCAANCATDPCKKYDDHAMEFTGDELKGSFNPHTWPTRMPILVGVAPYLPGLCGICLSTSTCGLNTTPSRSSGGIIPDRGTYKTGGADHRNCSPLRAPAPMAAWNYLASLVGFEPTISRMRIWRPNR
jgi:hypothetical protein